MRKGTSIVRVLVAVLGLVAVAPALAGCEGAEASLPPTKHGAAPPASIAFAPSHIAFASMMRPAADPDSAPATLDLGTILSGARVITQSAERTAAELPALRRAITLCALALFGVGILNAALLGAILHALRALPRGSATLAAAATVPAVSRGVSPEVAMPARADGPRTCTCGTPISSRTQSGRCRRCAKRVRAARAVA